jgi:hypothetical protein
MLNYRKRPSKVTTVIVALIQIRMCPEIDIKTKQLSNSRKPVRSFMQRAKLIDIRSLGGGGGGG